MMKIHAIVDHWAQVKPDDAFLTDESRQFSWREVRQWSVDLAATMAAELRPGDRIAVLAKNSIELAVAYFAASRADLIIVPLNFRLANEEWTYILNDSGARFVLADAEYADRARTVLPAGAGLAVIQAAGDDRIQWEKAPAADQSTPVAADGTYIQMYTSGTTGDPKGALLTHHGLWTNSVQMGLAVEPWRQMKTLVVMPLFHAGATIQLFNWCLAGASVYIMRDYETRNFIDTLIAHEIQLVGVAPAHIQWMVTELRAEPREFKHLESMLYGSAPMAVEVLRQAVELFACDFIQAYGMTEATAAVSILTAADHRRALAGRDDLLTSVGKPVMGTQIKIIDDNGADLPAGEVGEILISGPQVMAGYWRNDAASKATLAGGWLHSGDAGYLDDEGYLYISDRIKDMIISGGENIYAKEIEDVLFTLAGVADAAVVGIPDTVWGERPVAFLVCEPGQELTETVVKEHCLEQLAKYKCPNEVVFVRELPRSGIGKVLKRELRGSFAQSPA